MPKPATPHAAHDELLIARLYGGDVDDLERARALELVAGCEDCAALFADLGSIARATAALPTETRPRDFVLTEEDAARLRPRDRGWGQLLGLGRRRSFGGALVAVGFSGLLLTGAVSILGAHGTSQLFHAGAPAERFASDGTGSTANLEPGATPAPAATPAPGATLAAFDAAGSGGPAGDQPKGGSGTAAPAALPTAAPASPASTGETAGFPATGGVSSGGLTPTEGQALPPTEPGSPATSQSGPDGVLLILTGSSAAMGLGILILLAPALRRRWRGRPNR